MQFSEIKNGIKTTYVLTSNGGREAISEQSGFPLTDEEKRAKEDAAYVADCEEDELQPWGWGFPHGPGF